MPRNVRKILTLVALASVLATGGCTGVRRRLGMAPIPQPAALPTAAYTGLDRVFAPPGDGDGTFERIVFRADAAAPSADSVVLLDLTGPAVIRGIRLSLSSADPHWLRRVAIAMYWDDEPEPSVHVPIGDFFGNAFRRVPYASLGTGVAGDAFYAHLPMPFARRARIVLRNGTGAPLEGLAFDADVERGARLAEPVATLHALWSRDARPRPDRPHLAADIDGAGWFVGTALSAQGHEGTLAFLGGSGRFQVDGRALPPEELRAYLAAGSPLDTTVAGPLQGVVLRDSARARVAAFRWHLTAPIPFRSSFKLELERGRANREGAEYATVAYWYQAEPHGSLPALPGPYERAVPEVLVPRGAVRGDEMETVGLGRGAVRVLVPVPRPDLYEVVVFPAASPGAVTPTISVAGTGQPPRALEVDRPGAEPGDVLPGVVLGMVSASGRTVEMQLDAGGGGVVLPAAVQLRPAAEWVSRWWTIGSWPNLAPDAAGSLRYIWGPDDEAALDRTHATPDGRTLAWAPRDTGADGTLELASPGGTAYAQAFLYSPRDRSVVLVLESDAAHEVLVGDVPALERPRYDEGSEIELDAYLRAGWNPVLVKMAADDAPATFRMRAADPSGELYWARNPS